MFKRLKNQGQRIRKSKPCFTVLPATVLSLAFISAYASEIEEVEINLPTGDSGIEEQEILIPTPNSIDTQQPPSNKEHDKKIEEQSIAVPEQQISSQKLQQKLENQNLAEQEDSGYIENSALKLGNGALDIVTSILELPKTISKTTREEGLAVGLTVGLVKGIANTAEQAVSGAANMVTFPIPQEVEIDMVENPGDEFNMEAAFGEAFSDKNNDTESTDSALEQDPAE